MLKCVFFRRTQRGGGRNPLKSKLHAIARWLQRRMMWLTGITEEDLSDNIDIVNHDDTIPPTGDDYDFDDGTDIDWDVLSGFI